MDKERFEKQLEFCKEIDKEKFVERQTYLTDGIRKENDAEHSWHMAMMAAILSEYSNEKIDLAKTLLTILAHDLVEIYAGDTYAYDEKGQSTKDERERLAADKLYNILPDDQGRLLYGLWMDFETGATPEARFAKTLDNFQPLMLNDYNEGKSWIENGIKKSQVMCRNQTTPLGSREIWDYAYENIIMKNVEKGSLRDE